MLKMWLVGRKGRQQSRDGRDHKQTRVQQRVASCSCNLLATSPPPLQWAPPPGSPDLLPCCPEIPYLSHNSPPPSDLNHSVLYVRSTFRYLIFLSHNLPFKISEKVKHICHYGWFGWELWGASASLPPTLALLPFFSVQSLFFFFPTW